MYKISRVILRIPLTVYFVVEVMLNDTSFYALAVKEFYNNNDPAKPQYRYNPVGIKTCNILIEPKEEEEG